MIAQLDEITDLTEQLDGKQRMRGMIGGLSAEAEKVLRVTRRLNSTLRRLLDSRSTSTRLCVGRNSCWKCVLGSRACRSATGNRNRSVV